MSLSTCERCWDNPCTCGYGYRNWTVQQLEKQIKMLRKVLSDRYPEVKVSKEYKERHYMSDAEYKQQNKDDNPCTS